MKTARTGTRTAALLLASALGTFTPAAFAAEPNCRAIESTGARLSCYDAAFPPKQANPPKPGIDSSSGYKDPFLAEEARTTAKLKNICRGC
ncbi:type VI secretion protein [Bradyrhizobium sp. SHOUNA76]|uniref:type VI secretion protein n=1 Tax=Bradyrhizobium sp. SHOUNA76 TaxID=2908927 RepID=UPI001FF5ADFF|nr:type VI secretion protein [Bradyrhizobium sp. SHOUNA76]MCJ9704595.1 type VI secretion protein [Bradyrhizobium sp. SHOUNA76]